MADLVYSASLDGSSDAFSHADHADFKPTGAFTIGSWVKTATTGVNQTIFASLTVNPNVAGIFLNINTANCVQVISGNNAGTYGIRTGGTNVCDGKWHFVVATWNLTQLSVFVDGLSDVAPLSYSTAPVYAATNYVRVGCENQTGANQDFVGGNLKGTFIDNGNAWTQAQIATRMFQDLSTLSLSGLKGYWKFENNANDSSGNSHNLTDIGTPTYATDVPFNYYRTANLPIGGKITADGDYYVHKFLLADTGTAFTTYNSGNVAVLVVGGGGGGGDHGGGGGGGGVQYNASFSVTAQAYTVTVGDGGAGGSNATGYNPGTNGNDSIFSSITATGGGGGGANNNGLNGGCGGGAFGYPNGTFTGGVGSQGFDGGLGISDNTTYTNDGGGGGMGAIGGNASSSVGGVGGIGVSNSTSGTATYYAGGGGGGAESGTGGGGGNGGGGAGVNTGDGNPGTSNTGGGGGGARSTTSSGGKGGSGIVIIRYLTSDFSTSPSKFALLGVG